MEAEGAFLLHPPAEKGLLAGLWRWPSAGFQLSATTHLAAEALPPCRDLEAVAWDGWVQVYTHRRETISPLHLRLPKRFEAPGLRWVPAPELPTLALGRRDGRLRDLLETEGQTPLDLPPEVLSLLR